MFVAPYYLAELVLIFCWQASRSQEIAQLAVCEQNPELGGTGVHLGGFGTRAIIRREQTTQHLSWRRQPRNVREIFRFRQTPSRTQDEPGSQTHTPSAVRRCWPCGRLRPAGLRCSAGGHSSSFPGGQHLQGGGRRTGWKPLQHPKIQFCSSLSHSNLQTKTSHPEGDSCTAWISSSLNGLV